jgi:hypothetical protein
MYGHCVETMITRIRTATAPRNIPGGKKNYSISSMLCHNSGGGKISFGNKNMVMRKIYHLILELFFS